MAENKWIRSLSVVTSPNSFGFVVVVVGLGFKRPLEVGWSVMLFDAGDGMLLLLLSCRLDDVGDDCADGSRLLLFRVVVLLVGEVGVVGVVPVAV